MPPHDQSVVTCSPIDEAWEVYWPDPSVSRFESELVDLNREARARSAWVLEHFFSTLSFLEVLDRSPTHLRVNSEVARQLLGLDVVETLLRHVDGSPRAIRAYQGFEQVPMTSFLASTTDSFEPGVVNVNRLLAGLSNGYTFNLIGLDRRCPLLGELAEHLERLIGGRVEISAFISSGDIPSTPLHVDHPERLVIPVVGPKYWEVRAPTTNYPLRTGDEVPQSGDVVFAATIEPGEALAVPRAWVHRAETCGEFSVCLTIGMYRAPGAAHVVSCANRASESAELRRPLTVTAATDRATFEAVVDPGVTSLVGLVDGIGRRGAVARELASLVNRPTGSPLWELAGAVAPFRIESDPSTRRVRARHGGVYPARRPSRSDPGRLAVATARRVIEFPADSFELVLRCLSGLPATLGGLARQDAIGEMLVPLLLVEGVIELIDPAAMSFDRLCGADQ